MAEKVLKSYVLKSDLMELEVNVVERADEYVKEYLIDFPEFGAGTKALMRDLKECLISDTSISAEKMLETKFIKSIKERFRERANSLLAKELPKADRKTKNDLIGMLIQEMLGLGPMEFMLSDGDLEEIVVNSPREPIWVYHKEFGWLRSNVTLPSDADIQNYASIIARRVGKQITVLNPLLDAHLVTGDRANATLFPISGNGNTITIRRFRRDPWTVADFIENKTVNSDVMALIWLAMQYEMNMILSGGTASGKTSFMNICLPFIQPNQRVLTIEDTRELKLPSFLHWVPLTTREPNPEGKGGIQMLDLLVNSLRMRPDRIIVGEIRRQREAEVMFEAMHTGHSVYTTVHANTAEETVRRLTNPPIDIPATMLDSVHLNVVMFRNRRLGVRRILQVAEFIPERVGDNERIKANVLYRWMPQTDTIGVHAESIRLMDELSLHTGFSKEELTKDLANKKMILDWMVSQGIKGIEKVGRLFANYYRNPEAIIELAEKNAKFG